MITNPKFVLRHPVTIAFGRNQSIKQHQHHCNCSVEATWFAAQAVSVNFLSLSSFCHLWLACCDKFSLCECMLGQKSDEAQLCCCSRIMFGSNDGCYLKGKAAEAVCCAVGYT